MDITLDFSINGVRKSRSKCEQATLHSGALKKKNGADEGGQGPHSLKNGKSWRGCIGYVQIKRTISR